MEEKVYYLKKMESMETNRPVALLDEFLILIDSTKFPVVYLNRVFCLFLKKIEKKIFRKS